MGLPTASRWRSRSSALRSFLGSCSLETETGTIARWEQLVREMAPRPVAQPPIVGPLPDCPRVCRSDSGTGPRAATSYPGDFELWGSPTALGHYNVQLTVTDSTGATATSIFPLKVSSLIVDYFDNLPNGTIGVSYSHKLRIVGGNNSYSVSQVGGLLADGLSLNAGNLLVSGTPRENGYFFAVFQFADTASDSIQVTNYYTIGNGASTVAIGTNNNLGSYTVGSSPVIYLYACCASGYNWSVVGGSLPPGLSLFPSGNLSGTLSTVGSWTFMVSAADVGNGANVGYRQFVMTVTPIGLTTPTALLYGNVGTPYNQTLVATGEVGSLTWTLPSFNYLPPGLSLSSNGSISGTPTQTGQFQFTITATDTAGNIGTWSLSIPVYPPGGVTRFVAPNGNDSNPGTIGQPYLTIQRCATSVYGASTCMVRAGTYHETVTPNSGITIMPWNSESVTVDGTDPVTNWTVYQGSIYRAGIALNSDDTNQLFVGAQMMTEARWPNGDDLFHVNWANAEAGTSDSQLVDSYLPNIDWTGAKVHFLSGSDHFSGADCDHHRFRDWTLTMSLDSPDESGTIPGTVFQLQQGAIQPQAGGLYYLYRSLAALDKQGEWFYDSKQHGSLFLGPRQRRPEHAECSRQTPSICVRPQWAHERNHPEHRSFRMFRINMNASSANNILDGINAQYVSHFTDLPWHSRIASVVFHCGRLRHHA